MSLPLPWWKRAAIVLAKRRAFYFCLVLVLAVGLGFLYVRYGHLPPEYKYPLESALENGDVIYIHGVVHNIHKLDSFMENFKSNSFDQVRLTMYTIEGAPILQDLSTENGKTTLILDTTRDTYGDRTIKTYEVTDIVKETRDNMVQYVAELNTGEQVTLMFMAVAH